MLYPANSFGYVVLFVKQKWRFHLKIKIAHFRVSDIVATRRVITRITSKIHEIAHFPTFSLERLYIYKVKLVFKCELCQENGKKTLTKYHLKYGLSVMRQTNNNKLVICDGFKIQILKTKN